MAERGGGAYNGTGCPQWARQIHGTELDVGLGRFNTRERMERTQLRGEGIRERGGRGSGLVVIGRG